MKARPPAAPGLYRRAAQSERLTRIGKTIRLAEEVFGSRDRALKWLHEPKRKFRDKTPFGLLATTEGGRLVEEALTAIDEGYAA